MVDNSRISGSAEEVPVIVLNWNGWSDTMRCLSELTASPVDAPVWLVDNASDVDETARVVAEFPSVRVLRWERNLGWTGGYNRALKLAAADGHGFAYLLNNDAIPVGDFLRPLLRVAASRPDVCAVGSCIEYGPPFGFVMFDGEYHDPGLKVSTASSSVLSVSEVNGAGMLVRLSAMERDGYFDERYFCYLDDREWCRRMRSRGWSIALSMESRVLHHNQGSNRGENAVYYTVRNHFLVSEALPQIERLRAVFRHIYFQMRAANEARRVGERERAAAIVSGLYDGCRGRFGPRHTPPPRFLIQAISDCWPFEPGQLRRIAARLPLAHHRLAGQIEPRLQDGESE